MSSYVETKWDKYIIRDFAYVVFNKSEIVGVK